MGFQQTKEWIEKQEWYKTRKHPVEVPLISKEGLENYERLVGHKYEGPLKVLENGEINADEIPF